MAERPRLDFLSFIQKHLLSHLKQFAVRINFLHGRSLGCLTKELPLSSWSSNLSSLSLSNEYYLVIWRPPWQRQINSPLTSEGLKLSIQVLGERSLRRFSFFRFLGKKWWLSMGCPSSPPCGKIAALLTADNHVLFGANCISCQLPPITIPGGGSPSENNCLLDSRSFSNLTGPISLCRRVTLVSFRWVFVFAPGPFSQSSWRGRPPRRWTALRWCCQQSAKSRPAGPHTSSRGCGGAGLPSPRCEPETPCFSPRGSAPFPLVSGCLSCPVDETASLFARLCWTKTSNPSESVGCQGTPRAQSSLGTDRADQSVLAKGQTARMKPNNNRTNTSWQQLELLHQ